jgi:hypothetical protein
VIPVEVECLTVNSLVARHWRGKPLDLVFIDAEGHEAQIIPAIDFSAVRPRMLFYEACHLSAADARLVEQHLQCGGYSVHRMAGDALALLQSSACLAG